MESINGHLKKNKNNMHKLQIFFLFIVLTCCVMFSCGKDKRIYDMLVHADSIMESAPDSAYGILMALSDSVESFDDEDRMMYYVLMADACNKLYKQLPSDTILNAVADYYKENGTSNQQMKSEYLLGCYYRDNNDAPVALKHYQEAVECADTLDYGCDYITLFSTYGQMAQLFYNQYMLEESIEAYRQYGHYAEKAGDTYNSIRGIEFQLQSYMLLNDTVKVLELTDSVHSLFMKKGMQDKAARVFYKSMYIHLDKGEYQEVKKMIDEFESESGLFVNNLLSDSHYIRYYYAKGLYYLGVGQADSAECFFRMLIPTDNKYDAYDGLTRLYRSQSNADSTLKYSELRDNEFDNVFTGMQTEAVRQVSALYDYDRLEHQKELFKMESDRNRLIIWISVSIFVILLLLASIGFIIYKKNKSRKMEFIKMRFIHTLSSLDKLKAEHIELSKAYNELKDISSTDKRQLVSLEMIISNKQEEIEYMENVAAEYKSRYHGIIQENSLDKFRESSAIQSIRNKFYKPSKGRIILMSDKEQIYKELKSCLPIFNYKISIDNKLSDQEKLTAILILANFSTKEIGYILGTSDSRISNIRTSINQKLFGESSARTLSGNLNNMATNISYL